MNKPLAIEINDFSYAYQSHWTFLRKSFVKNVSLTVSPGEVFGFIGPNGAGKTTTIKALMGLTKSQPGELKVLGKPAGSQEALGSLGFLPEQPYFYDNIKVKEVVEMAAVLKGIAGKEIATEVDRVLTRVNIIFKKHDRLKSLSKGQVQRVGLAQALIGKPKLLILDEPFSGLDPIGRREFSDIFFELKKSGASIFISSHILSDIEYLCDRAGIMRKGQLVGVYDLNKLSDLLPGIYRLKVKNYQNIQEDLTSLASKVKERDSHLELEISDKSKAEKAASIILQSDAELKSYIFNHGGLEELFLQKVSEDSNQQDLSNNQGA